MHLGRLDRRVSEPLRRIRTTGDCTVTFAVSIPRVKRQSRNLPLFLEATLVSWGLPKFLTLNRLHEPVDVERFFVGLRIGELQASLLKKPPATSLYSEKVRRFSPSPFSYSEGFCTPLVSAYCWVVTASILPTWRFTRTEPSIL